VEIQNYLFWAFYQGTFLNSTLTLLTFYSLQTLSFNNNKITKYLHHSGIFSCLLSLHLNQNYITTIQDLLDLARLPILNLVEIQDNPLQLEGYRIGRKGFNITPLLSSIPHYLSTSFLLFS
jgi:hypothetical protein